VFDADGERITDDNAPPFATIAPSRARALT